MKLIKMSLSAMTIILVNGCGGSSGYDGIENPTSSEHNVTVNRDVQVQSLGNANKIHVNIDIQGREKNLYVLLTNYGESSSRPIVKYNAKSTNKTKETKNNYKVFNTNQNDSIVKSIPNLSEYSKSLKSIAEQNVEGLSPLDLQSSYYGSEEFCTVGDDRDGRCLAKTTATLRQVVPGVETRNSGRKTLNIFVSNDSFDDGFGCMKKTCVTQSMIDKLANTFLKPGYDNDIYDWVTNIYGEEWGNKAHEKEEYYIPANNQITILVSDLFEDDNPNGGVIGYFSPKDNYRPSSVSGSNNRIMFYIDSVMLGNENGDGFWEKNIYSTLAHEFQHMIHFYKKTVLRDAVTDTWINEMISETTEDILATKLNFTGTRGVDPRDGTAGSPNNILGRFPSFNQNSSVDLTSWEGRAYDYGKASSFGAFLVRNYGGAKVLKSIVASGYTDYRSVEDAIGQDFKTLLRDWGVAVMLSDKIASRAERPTYNTGNFIYDDYGDSTYRLGSVNFYNYNPKPKFHNYSTPTYTDPKSNTFYKIGSNVTGKTQIDLELNGYTEATLIAR